MIFLPFLYALINFIRGRGMLPFGGHVVAPMLWAVVTWFIASFSLDTNFAIAVGLITFVGMLIWLIGVWKSWGGWGLYFASWTWRWNPAEREVPWIDNIGLKLVPFITGEEHWTNGLRGTICMSLRGLYLLPLFYFLQAFSLGILVGLLQGPVYASMRWLAPPGEGTKYAEPVFAFVIGAAVAYRLSMGY